MANQDIRSLESIAREAAQGVVQQFLATQGAAPQLVAAEISAVTADGYTVELLDDVGGGTGTTFARVYSWPDAESSFVAGDKVVLLFVDQHPRIMATGGAGGGSGSPFVTACLLANEE